VGVPLQGPVSQWVQALQQKRSLYARERERERNLELKGRDRLESLKPRF
jgi:hypothetical protein